MVGKFTGQDVPAVGFSIGFERIFTILSEEGAKAPAASEKIAFIIEKGMSSEKLGEIFEKAASERKEGHCVYMAWMAKNKKFQKDGLYAEGYTDIREFFNK